jgi:hypothetical protein
VGTGRTNYFTLRSVSSLNNPLNIETNYCGNMKLDVLKIHIAQATI